MNIDAATLKSCWNTNSSYGSAFRRLNIEHQLEWYAGWSLADTKALMAISRHEIKPLESSQAISISIRKRELDERWTLIIELTDPDLEEVFIHLCCDIIEYSCRADDQERAVMLAVKRYKEWDRLLKHKKNSVMDERSQKGLIGELMFLISSIKQGRSAKETVEGRAGPDGGDQDFVFLDAWYEIKTVSISAEKLSISSLEQLGLAGPGELVIMRVDKCAKHHDSSFTLKSLVAQAEKLVAEYSASHEMLMDKLARYGYIALPHYDDQYYWCDHISHYVVDEHFPKITRSDVAVEISDAQYSLRIASLHRWERR